MAEREMPPVLKKVMYVLDVLSGHPIRAKELYGKDSHITGKRNWKKRVVLATGGWFDMTQSERVAYGYAYFLYSTQAGAYVLQEPTYMGNWDYYEVNEDQAFQSLVRNGKEPVARRQFPTQYEAWVRSAQR